MTVCAQCGFAYDSITARNAADQLESAGATLSATIASAGRRGDNRADGWSVLEYGGHVRDVLITQRERLLRARVDPGAQVVPMLTEQRVEWGEYQGLDPINLALELHWSAARLARSLRLLSYYDWDLELIYNYPSPQPRNLRWLAAHTVHEVHHHYLDIKSLLAAPPRPPQSA